MNNEEILEKQVEALEKLLQLRQAVIEELESKVSKLESEKFAYPGISSPWISTPFTQPYHPFQPLPYLPGQQGSGGTIVVTNTCPDGSTHQYPSLWVGSTSPICMKCGHPMNGSSGNITLGSQQNITSCVNAAPGNVPIHTTGYIQPFDPKDNFMLQNNVLTLTGTVK